jgi:hypothetical protein
VSFSYREISDIRSIGHLRAVLHTKGVAR